MYQHGMIAPILALVIWSLVMCVWLYVLRIPAMQKAKINPQEAALKRTLDLPPQVMWASDNYTHLMEQPTIFYAAALAGQSAGVIDAIDIGLGWTYVVLRVIHSVVHSTANIVMLRFVIFALSTLTLAGLVLRVTMTVFGWGGSLS